MVGSNKPVVNPGAGGRAQRRALPRPKDCTLPAATSASRALNGPLADPQRQRQRRARPEFTIGQEGQHRRMSLLDRPYQHTDIAGRGQHQGIAAPGRAHAGQSLQHPAKAPHFDPQPDAVRCIGVLGPECPRNQPFPRHVFRPHLGQLACEREQDRASHE